MNFISDTVFYVQQFKKFVYHVITSSIDYLPLNVGIWNVYHFP